MNYPEALAWLYSTQQFGIKLGLENTHRLLAAMENPGKKCRFLHVAGTNGKGSVCAMLDAMLRAGGRPTGLYTSPHLVNFRERIRVNGNWISEEEAADILTRLRDIARTWPHAPTFFELTTVLAIRHFANAGAETVVLETGMGGRLDATNAVTPIVSVITPIAIDHARWLGETLEKIAAEKAGIFKRGIPAVSARQAPEAAEVLRAHAAETGVSLRFVDRPVEAALGLRGTHQSWNAALAVAALQAAGIDLPERAIFNGLEAVEWPGRFQQIGRFVLDGGHNPHAAEQLVRTWRESFPGERALVVFGALSDKDYGRVFSILSGIADEVWLVPVKSARAASTADLARKCPLSVRIFESAEAAIASARDQPARILVTGSLFLIGEALGLLGACRETGEAPPGLPSQ